MHNVENKPSHASSQIGRWLQGSANLAVIVAAVCVAWLALQRGQSAPPRGGPPAYAVGDRIDRIDGVDFSAAELTLVLALREDCRFCRESLPFYRQLTSSAPSGARAGTRLIALSTDPVPSFANYLTANAVKVDQFARYEPGALKIPGTPFLFAVDRAGVVTHVWRGRLPTSREQEVFALLRHSSAN